ncbi:hypothetical protein ZWY2020_056507 [Hordeum vulgare]|nr:hypothetical protein ZWY2020_056507 [Hordeum vulgare]
MYVPAHRLCGVLSMRAMNHVLTMIVMKHVLGMIERVWCFRGLSVVPVQQTPASAADVAPTAKAKKDGRSNNMKWQAFMSRFVLNKMCELISSGVRTDKGFKEVHLNTIAKQMFEFCGQDVSATQVYNHLRKWRGRWIQVSKMRDLSGASWNENTCSIVLEGEHYAVHVAGGFSDEALMASLSHLLDNKVQGVRFIAMADAHMTSYSNNSHRGFKTRHATEQAYSDWVQKHGGNSVDSGKVGGVKVEDGTADRRLGLKLKNFIIFAQFIAIVVL